MAKAPLTHMRYLHAALTPWVMLALLLPVLLGVLPAAAPSAESAFAQSLAQSLCAPLGTSGDEAPKQHSADCILCATGCPVCGASLAPETASFLGRAKLATASFTLSVDLPATQSRRTRANPPRAPPLPA